MAVVSGGGGSGGEGKPDLGSDGLRPDLPPRHHLGSDVVFASAWDLPTARGRLGLRP
jgi:hypothetical protein